MDGGGTHLILRAKPGVTLLRGRRGGLEVALSGRVLDEAFAELEARLTDQPDFYRGGSAVANFGEIEATQPDVARLRAALAAGDVTLRALAGSAAGLADLAAAEGVAFEASPAAPPLSASARSLVADFAGARSDIAQRRKRGEASVRRAKIEPKANAAPELRLVEMPPGTLYHAATLRGGQTLHHAGNIVVVGDVNPGAELVASGDILVFGRLAGIAHAGARGDENARIYALDLAPTQLRIATHIAADEGAPAQARTAEAALVRHGEIVVLPLDAANALPAAGASTA